MSLNFAVFISGGGTNLQALIDAVESGQIDANLTLVISDRQGAYGIERAKKHNIPCMVLNKKDFDGLKNRDERIMEVLENHKIDFIMLAGYLSILTEKLVQKYEKRIINIHPALIPKYSGKGFYGDVIHKAVLDNGDEETGVTLHFVDAGVDSGPVIVQEKVKVAKGESLESLKAKIHALEHKLIVETAKNFSANRHKI
ncbi:phosphoribosylglycinamide formyltransferase [Fusibacter sp. JL216-2]|uniref:phosphoribosylglycinamide formyltransferase n=1 Tax=Fusibacter sp. JL216-2 TaxID=3071453 RepID=UPI003D347C85